MAMRSLTERIRNRRHELEALGRRATARVLGSPLTAWRLGASDADCFLIVPASILPEDPSRFAEIASGSISHDGRQFAFGSASPFSQAAPDIAFARYLNGFDWLGDLRAARDPAAAAIARAWTLDWIRRSSQSAVARETDVRRTRLRACLTGADVLLGDVDADAYTRIMGAILDDLYALATDWRGASTRAGAVCALMTVVVGALAIQDQDELLQRFEPVMVQELDAQILADGGHASRNAADVVDILIDLIPLIRTYTYLDRAVPEALPVLRRRMQSFLRTVRMGDLGLARFHGADRVSGIDLIATIVRLEAACEAQGHAAASGYVRCEAGATVLLADIGSVPPADLSCAAHAQCLAFEVSDGSQLLFVNAGSCRPPGSGGQGAVDAGIGPCALARSTASSNTLTIAAESSGRLAVANGRSGRAGSEHLELHGPLVGQADVFMDEMGRPNGFTACHDGYADRYGLRHRRTVRVANDGAEISGLDELVSADHTVRLASDLPFAIHFHVAVGARITTTGVPNEVRISLPQGRSWRFGCTGAQMYVEESPRFDGRRQVGSARQIVLRGACAGESSVAWTLIVEGRTSPDPIAAATDAPGVAIAAAEDEA